MSRTRILVKSTGNLCVFNDISVTLNRRPVFLQRFPVDLAKSLVPEIIGLSLFSVVCTFFLFLPSMGYLRWSQHYVLMLDSRKLAKNIKICTFAA